MAPIGNTPPNPQRESGDNSSAKHPIEHRWEIKGRWPSWTAKHVQEIPPDRAESLADTMAPIEELTSVLGCTVPWTVSAFTRRGLERRMRRFERKEGFLGERVELPRVLGGWRHRTHVLETVGPDGSTFTPVCDSPGCSWRGKPTTTETIAHWEGGFHIGRHHL